VLGIPATVVIDQHGKVQYGRTGFGGHTGRELVAAIDTLLKGADVRTLGPH
jgi:hypothetical protein